MPPTQRNPGYADLADQLRARIQNGALAPGDRLPTFAQMQAEFGTAFNTLDRAFAVLERDGLIVRRKGSGIYVAEPEPRRLKGAIGLLGVLSFDKSTSPYWMRLLEGVHDVADSENMELMLLKDGAQGWEKVDGVLMCTPLPQPDRTASTLNLPCVSLLHAPEGLSSVVVDEYAGTLDAARHLLEIGHRRIAFLGTIEGEGRLPRLEAYRAALAGAGIAPDPAWARGLYKASSEPYQKTGHDNMRTWLQQDWSALGCTALSAQNDETAIGAIEALQDAGLEVPGDVSVIGFDGTELSCYFRPRLTTVEVPLREIGATATEMLLQQIKGRKTAIRQVVLPAHLRVRESSTAPLEGG